MDNVVDARQSPITDTTKPVTTKPVTTKHWHAPKYTILDVNETAQDFIAVTDTTSFFS